MKNNIFIPKKIKVGFNKRTDTYTGKLGYIIYHDGKTWRKENSWDGWRIHYVAEDEYEIKKKKAYDDTIVSQTTAHKNYIEYYTKDPKNGSYYKQYAEMTLEDYLKKIVGDYKNYIPNLGNISSDKTIIPLEFSNSPIEGFVLNKKAGGYSSGWNHRQTYCRVYDPRGFEFEITIPNLLYILENSTSTKGKGLEGKFIYGWDGKDLVLIPEDAPEYKEMVEFTTILDLKVSKKDLKVGGIYLTASGEKVTYLTSDKYYDYEGATTGEKFLWFYHEDHWDKFRTISISTIKKYVGDNPDIAALLDKLEKQEHFCPKKKLKREYSYVLASKSEIDKKLKEYSYNKYEVYIPAKSKGKYIINYISYDTSYDYDKHNYRNRYILSRSRKTGDNFLEYTDLDTLLSKNQVYKQIMIKEDEK